MKYPITNYSLGLIIAFVCSGCGTFVRSHGAPDGHRYRCYPATRFDCAVIGGDTVRLPSNSVGQSAFWAFLGGIDLPISLATDTLLLPYDLAKSPESVSPPGAAAVTRPTKMQLSAEEVLRIAKQAAAGQNIRLTEFKEPSICDCDRDSWCVYFPAQPPNPPSNFFSVYVDDRSGQARVIFWRRPLTSPKAAK